MLTRRDALQHLLRLGLLTPDEVVAQDITASEYIGRNHLVRVERPGAPCYIVKQPRDANAPDATTMLDRGRGVLAVGAQPRIRGAGAVDA